MCLQHVLDSVYPAFHNLGLSANFDLRVSEDDNCVYAQNRSAEDIKVLIAYRDDLEDRKIDAVKDRLQYIKHRYG